MDAGNGKVKCAAGEYGVNNNYLLEKRRFFDGIGFPFLLDYDRIELTEIQYFMRCCMIFRDVAIKSAETYYNFLVKNNRSEECIQVLGIKKTRNKDLFVLQLKDRLKRWDYVQIKIREKIYDRKEIDVIYYSYKKKTLTIKPNADTMSLFSCISPQQIFVYSDLKYLVERVRDWYKKFGNRICLPKQKESISLIDKDLKDIASPDQYDAMKMAMELPFSYVWGAPGTGKTRFVLARCLMSYIEARKKVILLAPTNLALEQSLYGILNVMKEAGVHYEKYLLRLGESTEEFLNCYPDVCEGAYIARKANQTKVELNKRHEELEKVKQTLVKQKELLMIAEYLEKYIEIIQDLNDLAFRLRMQKYEADREINVRLQRCEEQKTELGRLSLYKSKQLEAIQELNNNIDKYSHGFFKLFKKSKKEEKQREKKIQYSILDDLCKKIKECENIINKDNEAIEELRIFNKENANKQKEVEDKLNNIYVLGNQVSFDCTHFQNCINSTMVKNKIIKEIEKTFSFTEEKERQLFSIFWRDEIQSIKEQIKKSSQDEQEIQDEIIELKNEEIERCGGTSNLEKYTVLAATVDTFLMRIDPEEFDVAHIFLDEAAYCPMIKGCTLLAYDCPITFLGDHMQLPPVCEMSGDKEIEKNKEVVLWNQSAVYAEQALTSSIEEIFRGYKNNMSIPNQFMAKHDLIYTHRFGEKLASILAKEVYTEQFQSSLGNNTELFYINVKCGMVISEKFNQLEADKVRVYLEGVLEGVSKEEKEELEEKIGILTPYKDQVTKLREIMREINKKFDDNIMTIHKSQGREWNTVIISVVKNIKTPFISTSTLSGKRLINTAISRAKKKLIIVCDVDYWKGQKKELICKLLNVATEIKIDG